MTKPGERLQKVLAHAGVASRRAAEELIAAGRVSVNGAVIREQGWRVGARDDVTVDGRPIGRAAGLVYFALNKPTGYVSTAHDPEGRPTVLDLVDAPSRVYPVGRLDWDSEGLLLLTNDGELAHRLTHPRFGIEKEYHALVAVSPNAATMRRLGLGVRLEDGPTARAAVARLRAVPDGVWLSIAIHEGRNRQVRRMLEAVGHRAERLVRVRVGPIQLGELASGSSRPLRPAEVQALRRATGLTGAEVARSSARAS